MDTSERRRGTGRLWGVPASCARTGRPTRIIPLAALLMASTAVLPLLANSPALSQVATGTTFNIPAGDLGSVLAQIGRAASQPISFPADLTRGRSAGPIVGRMSVQEALARALAGSGLVAVQGAGGALTIRGGATIPAAGSTVLGDIAAIDVTDTAAGSRDVGFTAVDTRSSARIDIPLKEDPRSVVGVTEAVIRTQAQTSALDVARNVSNVRISTGSEDLGAPTYQIRGFAQSSFLLNGVPSGSTRIPITDIERIDVIKGPTTEFGGPSFRGGAINAITKAPTATPIQRAEVFYGSRFFRTLAFDFGGPVQDLEGVTYRLNVSGNTANYALGGASSPHEALISPVVAWQGVDTRLAAGVRYIDTLSGIARYAPTSPDNFRPFRIQRDVPFGNLDNLVAFRSFNPYLEADQHLGRIDSDTVGSFDFKIRNRTSYFLTDMFGQNLIPYNFTRLLAGRPMFQPQGYVFGEAVNRLVTQSDLLIQHNTEFVRQTMRIGIDYLDTSVNTKSNIQAISGDFALSNPPQNLPYPRYSTRSSRGFLQFTGTSVYQDNIGIAFQDKIDILDRLHILGSVRHDWFNSRSNTLRSSGLSTSTLTESALTYTAGAVYDVLPWASVYGSVGTGFVPQIGLVNRTQPAPPARSNNSEFGLKLSLLDNNMTVTMARYHLENTNNLVQDNAQMMNRLGPGLQAEGYEIYFQGQVTENISLIGGYSYNNYKNARDPRAGLDAVISVAAGQPQHQANLFVVYTFTDGPLRGLSIGGGGRGQTLSYMNNFVPKAESPVLPGFITYDAMIGYTIENFRVDVSVRNILDRYYYDVTTSEFAAPVADGRVFMIRAGLDF